MSSTCNKDYLGRLELNQWRLEYVNVFGIAVDWIHG